MKLDRDDSDEELLVDSYLTGREQRLSGAAGQGFRDTRMGELVSDAGLVEKPDHGVGIWGKFAEAHELGKRGDYGLALGEDGGDAVQDMLRREQEERNGHHA